MDQDRTATERIAQSIAEVRHHLDDHPEAARYRDSVATATIDAGLRVLVQGNHGASVFTDMPVGIGGGASAPSPGWLLRAAAASCVATLISLRAAEQGVDITGLQVTVDSESDDRGMLGMDDTVPPGPLGVRVMVRVNGSAAGEVTLKELIRWGKEHCPICDAIGRAVPVELAIQID